MQEKYRSSKFRMLPMRTLKRFGEKWVTIKSRLTGVASPKPSSHLLENLRRGFLAIQGPFERLRHKPACSGSEHNCHKRHGCRNNMLHYNFVIMKLIKHYGGEAEAAKWADYFPQISKNKRSRLKGIWSQIELEVGFKRSSLRQFAPEEVAPIPVGRDRTQSLPSAQPVPVPAPHQPELSAREQLHLDVQKYRAAHPPDKRRLAKKAPPR